MHRDRLRTPACRREHNTRHWSRQAYPAVQSDGELHTVRAGCRGDGSAAVRRAEVDSVGAKVGKEPVAVKIVSVIDCNCKLDGAGARDRDSLGIIAGGTADDNSRGTDSQCLSAGLEGRGQQQRSRKKENNLLKIRLCSVHDFPRQSR